MKYNDYKVFRKLINCTRRLLDNKERLGEEFNP
jgi:hypothetical protein